ncbi:restriction endonuclease subunit S [Piscinibacter gummiphilus]|uniref:restriction endonuclease subunit S n=1 Tax=Piscinibacter gummiphilus TaxID=946333 RepID=UPI000A268818|nr:restriction endonuclease subunit S [Piscinibacter gummiphilus]ATU63062.1 restriction endonuclease subunit S [Piscinibacter gummiphilus]GLS98268.1 hypothetical protein GCM10007918_55600 [Piscinibacter gummiphilus]
MRSESGDSGSGTPTAALKTLATKIRSGATPRGGSSSYLGRRDRYTLVRSQNVLDHAFTEEGLANISDSQASELEGAELQPDDVLLNITGDGTTFGRSCLVPTRVLPACVNQHVMLIRLNRERCHPGFLAAWLALPETKAYIESFNAGGSRRAITKGHIESFQVPIPDLSVQQRIAEFSAAINDRIDLLRQTNATLESIAQALFKSWFIDFDPVRAKTEGREPEGMDAATAALFPAEFEESVLGLIPKGWSVQPIGELAEAVGGSTPDTKNAAFWEPALHHWTSPKDLSGATAPVLLDTERKVSKAGLAKISSGLLPVSTLLMSSRAPIGYLSVTRIPVAINQGYIAMLPGGQLPPLYLYFWCQANMDAIKGRANGSTFMEISKKAFRPIPALLPPSKVVEQFVELAKVLFDRLTENERQAYSLANLRDALLPRLISGKLRLPEAQAQLEDALA